MYRSCYSDYIWLLSILYKYSTDNTALICCIIPIHKCIKPGAESLISNFDCNKSELSYAYVCIGMSVSDEYTLNFDISDK